MKNDLRIKNGLVIPEHELEISTSRSGGAGGQHVNKTSTKVTVRWNVHKSAALSDVQKERLLHKLASMITQEGDIIVHSSASRSQLHNKKLALDQLAQIIRKALHVPKKRIATQVSEATKEKRLHTKSKRSQIKRLRSKKIVDE